MKKLSDDFVIEADIKDTDDCAKLLICQLNTKDEAKLDDMEKLIKNLFGTNEYGVLDVTKTTIRFDLAAVTGRLAGLEQCKTIYGRCSIPYNDMMKIMEHSANEI